MGTRRRKGQQLGVSHPFDNKDYRVFMTVLGRIEEEQGRV